MATDVGKHFKYLAAPSSVVFYVLFLSATVSAQLPPNDPCTAGTTVTIAFNELDPPGVPVPDPQLVSAADGSYIVTVVDDPDFADLNRGYKFSDFFEVRYNNGWYIANIRASDRDGQFSEITDDKNMFQFILKCQGPADTIWNILKIQMIDVNDNCPQFLYLPYSVRISENTPTGMTIYSAIGGTDLDMGINKQIVYSLSDSPGAQFSGTQYLTIALVGEGYVAVKKSPDYESLYAATNYRADQVYFNLTVTATDQGSQPRSNSTNFIVYILDIDDQGPQFLCPSCVQDEGRCVRPRYKTVIYPNASTPIALVLTPDPVNPNNPSQTIDIIMEDRDTLNSSVTCSIVKTIPGGFESKFSARTDFVGGFKQYKCTIIYLADGTNPFKELPEIEIVLKAQEQSGEKRSEYGSVIVKIFGSGSSNNGSNTGGSPGDGSTTAPKLCPPGFTEERIISSTSLCRATQECSPRQ